MARTITCSLNRETDDKLERLSEDLDVSKTEIIRMALNQFVHEDNKPKPKNVDGELFEESEDVEEDDDIQ